jgi:hypothetical protein
MMNVPDLASLPSDRSAAFTDQLRLAVAALSRLEAGGVVPTIPLLERISVGLDADLIVELAPHAA